ncbi:MAG: hypothetical protein WCH39_10325 [Schlesneria sp.]
MSQSKQLDFINDFEAADRERAIAERQREVTHEIIDQSAADCTVKSLLHMLADFPRRTKDERGNWLITASVAKMESRLGRSRNTVRAYIRSACQVGFLEILDPTTNHDERTYVIHWRSILDRELTQPDATSTAQHFETDPTDATSTSNTGSRGSITTPGGGQNVEARGSIYDPEGVNLTPSGGQIDRVKTRSSEERLRNVLEQNVNTTSSDVLNVFVPGGGQSRKQQRPMKLKFWVQWEEAVRVSDLGNARHVQDLYEMLTSMLVIQRCDANRNRVFANAAMNERMWKNKEALKRKGLFLTNTALQRWFFNHLDQLVATRMIHELDHPTGGSLSSRVAAAAQAVRESPAKIYSEDEAPGPTKTMSLVGDLADAWGLVKTVDTSAIG